MSRGESCRHCGMAHAKAQMCDVVILARGSPPEVFETRWCKPCAKESEDKPWFAYADSKKADGFLAVAKLNSQGAEASIKPDGTLEVKRMDKAWETTKEEYKEAERGGSKPTIRASEAPKKASGWQLMKAKYATAASARQAIVEAKASGKAAGTIRVLEGLLKMREKEEASK